MDRTGPDDGGTEGGFQGRLRRDKATRRRAGQSLVRQPKTVTVLTVISDAVPSVSAVSAVPSIGAVLLVRDRPGDVLGAVGSPVDPRPVRVRARDEGRSLGEGGKLLVRVVGVAVDLLLALVPDKPTRTRQPLGRAVWGRRPGEREPGRTSYDRCPVGVRGRRRSSQSCWRSLAWESLSGW